MRLPNVFCTVVFATMAAGLTLELSSDHTSAAGVDPIAFATESHGAAPSASEFRNSCAVCHGVDGQGNGPMAVLLKVKPPDLTRLAARNGGKFPFDYVMRIIDGRATVGPHGTREMPIWGDRYMRNFPKTVLREPHRSKMVEPLVRARILELTYYLRSIQK
jgi:mono/diheme cytochrome c family protein